MAFALEVSPKFTKEDSDLQQTTVNLTSALNGSQMYNTANGMIIMI